MKINTKLPIYSFFRFYYYVITRSPKRFEEATTHPNDFYISITPLVFFLLYVVISAILLPVNFLPLMFLWIPIIIGNFAFSNSVADKWRAMEREREYEEREARNERVRRQAQEERWARERARQQEEMRYWEDYVRRMAEQERIKRQQQQRQWQYNQYDNGWEKQQPRVDNNMKNAIKLLGLKDNFTEKDVKSAYRKLSKVHHPDVGGLEANFKRLNKAYEYVMARI